MTTAMERAHGLHSPAIASAIDAFRARVRERFGDRLSRLVMFGSMARGDAAEASDVDVLTLVRDMTLRERREIYEIGAEIWMDTRVRIAPLAMSDSEYADLVRLERLLPREIERDGIEL